MTNIKAIPDTNTVAQKMVDDFNSNFSAETVTEYQSAAGAIIGGMMMGLDVVDLDKCYCDSTSGAELHVKILAMAISKGIVDAPSAID